MQKPRRIIYVTSLEFKQEECREFENHCSLVDGRPVKDLVHFEFRNRPGLTILNVDIKSIVEAGVQKAYSEARVPCIVEYAGLIFEKYKDKSYPGGITKAMWDSLGDQFLTETHSAGERAVARAVVAFCDGLQIMSFTGETKGRLADAPRGERAYYWDTVFIPDEEEGGDGKSTYSEIVADPKRGLRYKMERLSQSAKALRMLVAHVAERRSCGLWY